MGDHLELAQMADRGGIAALWVRDVPMFDPNFGDVGQNYDPFADLGYLAAATQRITLGTAGIVAPLRHPIHIAKQAVSVDHLSRGRFLLGLSSGDRPAEYPAFGYAFDNRAERFRDSWRTIRALLSSDFPRHQSAHYGKLTGTLDLTPKPLGVRLPMLTIGRARQDMDWFARESDAWIWHGVNPAHTGQIVADIAARGDGRTWHPFGYANFLELTEDPTTPARLHNNIYLRTGRNALIEFWQEQQSLGLAHVTINLKPSRRSAKEVLQELIDDILPHFPMD